MKPVLIGLGAAALLVGAFMLGSAHVAEPAGPAQQIGEAVDEAAGDLQRGVQDAAD